MYDAIVIGARCSGAATAMLARQGHRVLVLDRAAFPSDVHSGPHHTQTRPRRLADRGLLERIVGTNCPPVLTHLTNFGDFPLIGRDIQVENVAWGFGPRRRYLDKVLVEAAIEAGVEFRSNFRVESLLWNGDQVDGIRGRDRQHHTSNREKAHITIGAESPLLRR